VDPRDERIARNEKSLRDVNRELEQISEDELHAGKHSPLEILCECGREGCFERITLSIAEYEAAHSERDRFVLRPGHESTDIEYVVERTESYVIVDKFGEAEEIAER
jgi:hypothetical protein